jgi:hypothetical protein
MIGRQAALFLVFAGDAAASRVVLSPARSAAVRPSSLSFLPCSRAGPHPRRGVWRCVGTTLVEYRIRR